MPPRVSVNWNVDTFHIPMSTRVSCVRDYLSVVTTVCKFWPLGFYNERFVMEERNINKSVYTPT